MKKKHIKTTIKETADYVRVTHKIGLFHTQVVTTFKR